MCASHIVVEVVPLNGGEEFSREQVDANWQAVGELRSLIAFSLVQGAAHDEPLVRLQFHDDVLLARDIEEAMALWREGRRGERGNAYILITALPVDVDGRAEDVLPFVRRAAAERLPEAVLTAAARLLGQRHLESPGVAVVA